MLSKKSDGKTVIHVVVFNLAQYHSALSNSMFAEK